MTGRRTHLAGRGRAVAACPGCSHGGRFGKTDASFPHKDVNGRAGRLPSGLRSFWGGLEIEATEAAAERVAVQHRDRRLPEPGQRGEGIVKVVGEVGSGKTMLCRMLQLELPKTVEIVYIANPSVSPASRRRRNSAVCSLSS